MGKRQSNLENERSSFTKSLCIEPVSVDFVTNENQALYGEYTKDSIKRIWDL